MKSLIGRWPTRLALVLGFTAVTNLSAFDGRWKVVEDGSCYWDDADSGPDQCAPGPSVGRWKIGGDHACVWDPEDTGPDQCAPADLAAESAAASPDDTVASLPSSSRVPAAAERGVQPASAPAVTPGS